MHNKAEMGKKKFALKVNDWASTPYHALALSEGSTGLNWHTVFRCDKCRCLFSRLDPAKKLKAKPKVPGKQVVSQPPEIPVYCGSCAGEGA